MSTRRDSDRHLDPPRRNGAAGTGGSSLPALSPRLLLGASLIFLGVVFVLENLGLVDADEVIQFWPLLLVLFGVAKLAAADNLSEGLFAGFWIFIGGWILAYHFELVPHGILDLWPLALVLLGASLILRAVRIPGSGGAESANTSHGFALMGGVVRKNNSSQFRGGSLTAIMGGCELDLRQAEIGAEEALIDTFAVFGGIEIRVPTHWTVISRVVPIMGGYEDKTSPPLEEDAGGRLVVTGWAIMGGVEVKN